MFNKLCEDFLDLSDIRSHLGKLGDDQIVLIDFEYFLTVYKTAFFWKKMQF